MTQGTLIRTVIARRRCADRIPECGTADIELGMVEGTEGFNAKQQEFGLYEGTVFVIAKSKLSAPGP